MQPDWDMFQSLHPAAEYHASARAISGGPIYVRSESQKVQLNCSALKVNDSMFGGTHYNITIDNFLLQ